MTFIGWAIFTAIVIACALATEIYCDDLIGGIVGFFIGILLSCIIANVGEGIWEVNAKEEISNNTYQVVIPNELNLSSTDISETLLYINENNELCQLPRKREIKSFIFKMQGNPTHTINITKYTKNGNIIFNDKNEYNIEIVY